MIGGLLSGLVARVAAVGIVIVLSVTLYAYTSSNSVAVSRAGNGSGAVTGYTIVANSAVYTLNSTSPQSIASVQVTLSAAPPAGATMKAQLRSGGTWFTCTNSGTTLTCPTTGETVTNPGTMSLTIVVAD